MEIVNSWKPLTIFGKSSIVDVRLGFEYTSAIRLIRNETIIWTYTRAFYVWRSARLLQVCIFGLNTITNSSNTKTAFSIFLGLFKGFLMYIQQILCNKILSKKSRWNKLKQSTQSSLYVIIMSRLRLRVNLHSIAAWMSKNSLLEKVAIS